MADFYLDTIFPNCTQRKMIWNNHGSVVVTIPMNHDAWINSRFVSSSTGVAYDDLRKYLQNEQNEYTVYQPVSIVYSKSGQLSNFTTFTSSVVQGDGKVVVPAVESYAFVDHILSKLAAFGCHLQSFLQVQYTILLLLYNCDSYILYI